MDALQDLKALRDIDADGTRHLLQEFQRDVKERLKRKQGKNEKAQQKAARRAAKWAREVDARMDESW